MMQEIQPNRDEKEDDRHWQVDDINIPLVAVSVAFFGVLLAVTIISLQAWFYGAKARETAAKTLPQEDRQTVLGGLLYKQRAQLNDPSGYIVPTTSSASATTAAAQNTTSGAQGTTAVAQTTRAGAQTTTAAASQTAPRYHIPIDLAMEQVARQYGEGSR